MYLTAIKNNQGCEGILGKLPKSMLTPELCQCAVESSGYNLEFVPEEMKTREMCRTSLYSSADLGYEDCDILQYIPYSDVCLEGLDGYIAGRDAKELIDLVHPKAFDSSIARLVSWNRNRYFLNGCPSICRQKILQKKRLKASVERIYSI